MSFLGDIADAIGIGTTGVPWGSLVSAGSSLLGFAGQQDTNQANEQIAAQSSAASAAQAQRQMDFQEAQNQKAMDFSERMSGSSYQRGVKDMEAAGLNPMLAYSQGGASSPSGVTSSGAMGNVYVPQIGNRFAAGMNAAAQANEVMTQSSQRDVNEATINEKNAHAVQSLASAGQLDATRDSVRQEMQSFERRMLNLDESTRELTSRIGYNVQGQELRGREAEMVMRQLRANLPEATVAEISARAHNYVMQSRLLGLEVPEAISAAAFWKRDPEGTKYGIMQGVKTLGSAGQAVGRFGLRLR